MLTYDDLTKVLSPRLAKAVPPSVITHINDMLSDPDMCETYRDNLVSYQSILTEGKWKLSSYVDAVKFVSHKLRGISNKEAYLLTFPNKQLEWDTKNTSDKDQYSYISMYAKGKLVTKILEQAIMPTWIVNQELFQEALNNQAELMRHAKSEMVRFSAGKSILETLKRPDAVELKVDMSTKESSVIKALKDSVEELVIAQRKSIEAGGKTAQDIAEMPLTFEGEYDEVE